MVHHGVCHIPEDRHRRGLVLQFTLAENLALRDYDTPEMSPLRTALAAAHARARAAADRRVRRPRRGAVARSPRRCRAATSRRSSCAREIGHDPRLLVAAQPTRGLDVGAIEFVHRRLVAERDAGRAVLLVSLEFEEVRSLADRILVIYEGQIVGEFPPDVYRGGARHRDDRRRPPERGSRRERARPRAPGRSRARGRAGAGGSGDHAGCAPGRLHARRRHHRPGADDPAGVLRRRPGDPRHRPQPALDLQGDLQRHRPELVLPVDLGRRPHDGGAQPPADPDHHHAADPRRARGGLRLPRRPVQHRRSGPVPRRHATSPCGSARRSRACRSSRTSCSRSSSRRSRAPCGPASRGCSRRRSAPTR